MRDVQMGVGLLGGDPPARRPVDEARHEQVGLAYVLEVIDLLADRSGDRLKADRAAPEPLDYGAEVLDVDLV